MSVRPRSNGFQVDFSHNKQRIRRDGFATRVEAEQWEREQRTRLERGETVVSGSTGDRPATLRDLANRVYDLVWKGQRSEDTAVANSDDVVDILGVGLDPSRVSTAAIDGLVKTLEGRGLSNATINRKLAALSRMLHFAKDRGWIISIPKIERRKESEHRVRFLSKEEETAVCRWYENTGQHSMADFVRFLLDTGLRLSEAMGLEWGMVRTENGRGWVDVPPALAKSGRARSIPMTLRVLDIVTRRRRECVQDTLLVWHDLDYWGVEYQWRKMREWMGMQDDPHFVLHILRHTFCSRLAMMGVPLQQIQALAGHRTISVTLRYAHLNDDALVGAVARLNAPAPAA